MTQIRDLYDRMITALNVEDLSIPTACVKFYSENDEVPAGVREYEPSGLTLTSCQSTRQASFGDSVLLTRESIGCVAAAITFGLVDKNQDTVYACTAAGRSDFALFGSGDTGRYDSPETAKRAMSDMIAIQPATTKAVFLYALDFDDEDVEPDVVVLSVRPVELTRIIQAYQFHTGKRVNSSMGGLRVVNSDLIVRPYLTQEINVSTYCLGARLIAEFEADRLGVGMPYKTYKEIVEGMEDSTGGFPFQLYPGAKSATAA